MELKAFLDTPTELLGACASKEQLRALLALWREVPERAQGWVLEAVETESVENLLRVPGALWPHVANKLTMLRLIEIRDAPCLPWIVNIVREHAGEEQELEKVMSIPTRLLLAFSRRADLEWALDLAETAPLAAGAAGGNEELQRAHTNKFVGDSHKSTLDVLSNAALQKMLCKRSQLEEELKALESKIHDHK